MQSDDKSKPLPDLGQTSLYSAVQEVNYFNVEELAEQATSLKAPGFDLKAEITDCVEQFNTDQAPSAFGKFLEFASPDLGHDVEEMVDFFGWLLDRGMTSFRHGAITGFANWLEANKHQINQIYGSVLASVHKNALVFSVILAWKKFEPRGALSASLAFCDGEKNSSQFLVCSNLGRFEFDDLADDFGAFERILRFTQSTDKNLKFGAIQAVIQILAMSQDDPKGFRERVLELLEEPELDELIQITDQLANDPESVCSEIRIALQAAVIAQETIDHRLADVINHLLMRMNLEANYEFVNKIAVKALGQNEPQISISSLSQIQAGSQELRGRLAVDWLQTGNFTLGEKVSQLFGPFCEVIFHVDLSGKSLNDQQILFLMRKVFGHLFLSRGPATSILFACLVSISDQARYELEMSIVGFWLRNYPSDIELFERISAEQGNQDASSSVEKMAKAVDAYLNKIELLPMNTALAPSSSSRYVQNTIRYEEQRAVQESVPEQGLMSLFKKSTVLYGSAVVTHIKGGHCGETTRQTMPMMKHTLSYPLARMQTFSPVWLAYQLARFRNEECPS